MKIEVENAQQNEQVDWNKNPQLVEYKDNTRGILIIAFLSNLEDSADNFKGICLIDEDKISPYKIGTISEDWFKDSFKPFYGKITLSND